MRKIISVLLAVVLLLGICNVAAFAAESELTLSTTVSKDQAERGDIITAEISLDKNAGLRSLFFRIDYDPAVLEICCDSTQSEHTTPDMCAAESEYCVADVQKTALATGAHYGTDFGVCSKNRTDAPYNVTWNYGTCIKAVKYTGVICTVKFKVKDTAAFAKSDIKIIIDEDNCEKFISDTSTTTFANPLATGASVTVICPHDGGTTGVNDATHHWTRCDICKEPVDTKTPHTFNKERKNSATLKDAANCGNDAVYYKSCECGRVSTNANDTFTEAGTATGQHIGGTATCTAQAICTVCNKPYGTTKDHEYNVTKNNTTHHWQECACGKEQDGSRVTHTFDQKVENDQTLYERATCSKDAVYYYSCKCGVVSSNANDTYTKVGSATGDHVDKDGGTWKFDGTYHWHECGCGQKFIDKDTLGTEKCSGGTATCESKAKCTVCKNEYGFKDADNHTGGTTLINAKPAKCYEDGYTGDQRCNGCNEITKYGSSISKTTVAHTPGEWKTNPDNTEHYRNCTVAECLTELDRKAHEGGTATCTTLKKCDICKKAYGTTLAHKYTKPGSDATHHWKECVDCSKVDESTKVTHTFNKKVENSTTLKDAATCSKNEVYYFSCDCGVVSKNANDTYEKPGTATGNHKDADNKWNTNANQHYYKCDCGHEFNFKDHEGGTATCTAQAKCSACGTPYGETAKHSYTVPQKDATHHWNKCANCTATDTKRGHTYDQQKVASEFFATKATCTVKDLYYKSCKCGAKGTETFEDANSKLVPHKDADGKWNTNETQHFHKCSCGHDFDFKNHEGGTATCKDLAKCSVCSKEYGQKNAANHLGDTEIRDAKEPKCNEEGYTGDTYCKDCNAKIKDGEKIDKIPHVVAEWNETKPATTEEKGEKSGLCTGCSATIKVETAKLVAEIKTENVTGGATIENLGSTNISEDTFFSSDEVTETIAKEDKTAIEDAIKDLAELEGKDIAAIYDMSLVVKETDVNGDKVAEEVLMLDGKVRISLKLDAKMLTNYSDLKLVLYNAEGEASVVPYTIENDVATFEANEFNYYSFVGTKIVVEEEKEEDDNTPSTSPETGDSVLFLAFAIVALAIAAAALVISKKRARA